MIRSIVKRVSINRLIHTCVSFLEGTINETPNGFYHWWFFWIHNSNKFIKRVCHTTDLNNRINDSEEGVAFTWVIVTCSDEMKFIINFSHYYRTYKIVDLVVFGDGNVYLFQCWDCVNGPAVAPPPVGAFYRGYTECRAQFCSPF